MAVFSGEGAVGKYVDYMGDIEKKVPVAFKKDLWKTAQKLGGELRFSMARTLPTPIQDFDGTIRAGTYPKKSGDYTYNFLMPRHASYLDSMIPHLVTVKGNPPLERWMQVRGYHPGRDGKIVVRPRPFIDRAFKRTNARMDGLIKKGEVIKTLKGEI